MAAIKRTKKEYGGFLPLELNDREEYFAKYEPYLMRFNSVKAAFYEVIKKSNKDKIYIPYYYCPSTIEAIKKTGIETVFYHIDSNLEIESVSDDKDSIVLLVDYFGIKDAYVNTKVKEFIQAEVIIDRAHDFYAKPVDQYNIHNVYSAKKFFGIPDGAYLVSRQAHSQKQILSEGNKYASYLLKTYECGTNVSYSMKKDTDLYLATNYACMSKLSLGLLKNIDYLKVKEKRCSNYEVLRKAFIHINELSLPIDCPAHQFPLLIKGKGEKIKHDLVEEKIYVSTLWSGDDLKQKGNEYEVNMMKNTIFLPIDQRYNAEDMEYLVDRIMEMLK